MLPDAFSHGREGYSSMFFFYPMRQLTLNLVGIKPSWAGCQDEIIFLFWTKQLQTLSMVLIQSPLTYGNTGIGHII